jgi:hypothetical protein
MDTPDIFTALCCIQFNNDLISQHYDILKDFKENYPIQYANMMVESESQTLI